MFKTIAIASAMFAAALVSPLGPAQADDGLVQKKSGQSFAETLAALQAQIEGRGLKTFAVIDHAAGAASAGRELRPTTLVIFGNPKLGSPVMEVSQTAGLDLPIRVLVYEDAKGETWLAYWQPRTVAFTHGVPADLAAIDNMTNGLASITNAAAGKEPIPQ